MCDIAADGEARWAILRVSDDALLCQAVDGGNVGNLQRRFAVKLGHALVSHTIADDNHILHCLVRNSCFSGIPSSLSVLFFVKSMRIPEKRQESRGLPYFILTNQSGAGKTF